MQRPQIKESFPKLLCNGVALLSMSAALGSFTGNAEAKLKPEMTQFPKAVGDRTLVMVGVEFEGQKPLPFGNDVIRQQTFDAPGSVADYYRQASFGQLSLRGEAIGPVRLKPNIIDYACTTESLKNLGRAANHAALRQLGRNLDGYQHYGFILPRTSATASCDFGGQSFGNGFAVLETRGKHRVSEPHKFSQGLVTHELGHNFGLGHANLFRCKDSKNRLISYTMMRQLDGKCMPLEYGGPVDPMGLGHFTTSISPDMNAYHKADMGWIPSSNIKTIKRDSILKISPLETASSNVQLIRVPTGMTTNDKPRYFYLDYRQSVNLDVKLTPNSSLTNGIYINEAGPLNDDAQEQMESSINFIDTTPGTKDVTDGTLLVGKTFKDTSTGIAIKTLEAGPEGAKIQISGLPKEGDK